MDDNALTRPEVAERLLKILGKITGKDQSNCSEYSTMGDLGIGVRHNRDQTLHDLRVCIEKNFRVTLNYCNLPHPVHANKTTVEWLIDHIVSMKPVLETI